MILSGMNRGGLLKDYQAMRLRTFVAQAVADAKAGKKTVDTVAFVAAFRARQQEWVYAPWNSSLLPAVAVGDTVAIARRLQAAVV